MMAPILVAQKTKAQSELMDTEDAKVDLAKPIEVAASEAISPMDSSKK